MGGLGGAGLNPGTVQVLSLKGPPVPGENPVHLKEEEVWVAGVNHNAGPESGAPGDRQLLQTLKAGREARCGRSQVWGEHSDKCG